MKNKEPEETTSQKNSRLLVEYFDTQKHPGKHLCTEERFLAKVGEGLVVIDPFANPYALPEALNESKGDIIYVAFEGNVTGKHFRVKTFSCFNGLASYFAENQVMLMKILDNRRANLHEVYDHEDLVLGDPVDVGDVVSGSPEVNEG